MSEKSSRLRFWQAWWLCLGLVLLSSAWSCSGPIEPSADAVSEELSQEPARIQLLSLSEWAGQVEPNSLRIGTLSPDPWQEPKYTEGHKVSVGGAAAIRAYWAIERERYPNATLALATGDSFGVSPPLVSFSEEEPAVVALNLMGLDLDTFGNHNFNRGLQHLQRMVELAEYRYLAANLTNVPQNIRAVSPFTIRNLGGVPVAFIGVIDREIPALVFPGSFGTMMLTDEIEAALEARRLAKEMGATLFVLIAHHWTQLDGSDGNMLALVRGIDAREPNAFAVVFGDTTEVPLACAVEGEQVRCEQGNYDSVLSALGDFPANSTEASTLIVHGPNKGQAYGRVWLDVIPATGELLGRSVEFVLPVSDSVQSDGAVEAAMLPYRQALDDAYAEILCECTGTFVVEEDVIRTREMPAGNLIVDAIYQYSQPQLAVLNSGGYRSSLPSDYRPEIEGVVFRRPPDEAPWDLLRGDVNAILPFQNFVVEIEASGADIWAMLENAVTSLRPEDSGAFLQISGFRYIFSSLEDSGKRVCFVELDDGTVISNDSTERFKLATIDFLSQGGDGYKSITRNDARTREPLVEVVIRYLESRGSIDPSQYYSAQRPRITDIGLQGRTCEQMERP
ncbi:MAG: 5'-nucleotidase C-terminal domain-containing protein [Myxococcota bacterium]|jgi:5'-nucleotidase|nr:5'-nucleotidase C-terminal domain-containing protein [Myxococcota bacterium]